ncbi:hypothetical protein CCP2SC5_2330001 [Azospirillaceae bacterium]
MAHSMYCGIAADLVVRWKKSDAP